MAGREPPCCEPCWDSFLLSLFRTEGSNGYAPVVAAPLPAPAPAPASDDVAPRPPSALSAAPPTPAVPVRPVSIQGAGISNSSGGGLHDKYDMLEEIGVGSTSTCYRCVRKSDGREFACKVIDKRDVEQKFAGLLDQFNTEVKILSMLKHPNIIRLEDSYETAECVFMVLEMMQGGELFDYVVEKGTLSEEEASLIVRKITSAVAHMHASSVIHRDLKPENLLLTTRRQEDAEVKLIDFGLAKIMMNSETAARSFLGTKGYLAPEMLQRAAYDKAVDIWALGVIVFVLLCGCLPFDDDSTRIATESAARKKFTLRFPRWATNLSASAKDLLHNLLDVNPKTRFTADQALGHPWVSGKSVQPNSYLQSPSLLGERRKKEREARAKLEGISEEGARGGAGGGGGGGGARGMGVAGSLGARPRKNSI